MLRIADNGQHLHLIGKPGANGGARPGCHLILSIPRYIRVQGTYLNNLFSKSRISAYDSFLNISIPCREQLTTYGHDLRRIRSAIS